MRAVPQLAMVLHALLLLASQKLPLMGFTNPIVNTEKRRFHGVKPARQSPACKGVGGGVGGSAILLFTAALVRAVVSFHSAQSSAHWTVEENEAQRG